MTVSLVRGQKVNFTKEYPSIKKVDINLQWSLKKNIGTVSSELELDASLFLLDAAGKCRGDQDMVFYGNANGYNGAVVHEGKKNVGNVIQEGLKIDLDKLPRDVEKVAVTLTIYEGGKRQQSFSMVENISASIVGNNESAAVCRFDLSGEFTVETAIVVCELYRKNGEWRLNAVGAGYQGGLVALCQSFGIDVSEEENEPEIAPTPVAKPPAFNNRATPPPFPAINLSNPTAKISLPGAETTRCAPMNLSLPSAVEAATTSASPPSLLLCQCGAALKIGAKFCTACGKPR